MEKRMKSISVQIDHDTWLLFKIMCARKDRTISEMVCEILSKYVEEEGSSNEQK